MTPLDMFKDLTQVEMDDIELKMSSQYAPESAQDDWSAYPAGHSMALWIVCFSLGPKTRLSPYDPLQLHDAWRIILRGFAMIVCQVTNPLIFTIWSVVTS